MRLSWNELRARAAEFARNWADAAYEKGETQSFYNEFFAIFGLRADWRRLRRTAHFRLPRRSAATLPRAGRLLPLHR